MKKILLISTAILICAVVQIANAQTNTQRDGKIYVKILKNIDGKETIIDTVFEAGEDRAAEEFMKQHGVGNSERMCRPNVKSDDDGSLENLRLLEESLNESKEALGKVTEDVARELERIHIELENDDNSYTYQFDFDNLELDNLRDELDKTFRIETDTVGGGVRMTLDFKGIDAQTQAEIERNMELAKEELERAASEMKNKNLNIRIKIDDKPINKDSEKTVVIKGKKHKGVADKSTRINNLKVFPNPSKGNFQLSFSSKSKGDLKVEISDASGKVISTESITDFTGKYERSYNFKSRGKGTYVIMISLAGESYTEKVIVD